MNYIGKWPETLLLIKLLIKVVSKNLKNRFVQILSIIVAVFGVTLEGLFITGMSPRSKMLLQKLCISNFSWYLRQSILKSPTTKHFLFSQLTQFLWCWSNVTWNRGIHWRPATARNYKISSIFCIYLYCKTVCIALWYRWVISDFLF